MAYKITDKCISCGACAASCPVSCISQGEDKYVINKDACISCGTCEGVCPVGAPEPNEEYNNNKKARLTAEFFLAICCFFKF